jgi:hypothetical protein
MASISGVGALAGGGVDFAAGAVWVAGGVAGACERMTDGEKSDSDREPAKARLRHAGSKRDILRDLEKHRGHLRKEYRFSAGMASGAPGSAKADWIA